MEIRILDFQMVNDGLLKALVSIEIDGWIIKGLRVTKHEGRKAYAVMSKSSILDPTTRRIHLEQLVFLPADLWPEVERVVLQKFEEEINKENGIDEPSKN